MRSPLARLGLPLLVFLLAACAGPREAGTTLTVSAASSLQEALEEVVRGYEAGHPGVRVRLNFASSGTLQQQIQLGAPVDLFLSAAEEQMDALQARGLIDPATRRSFAANELVLIAPRAGETTIRDFADLASPRVERVALGAPASVPAGRYGEEVLRSLGILVPVMEKAVLGQHVRQVLTYVERGEVDAGIVYRTDAAVRPGVRIVAAAPAGSHSPVSYPLAVVATSESAAEAAKLADHLLGAEGQRVLRRFGFLPPPPHP